MNPVPASLTAALADRYRLERELGQGGMATVYLAEDLKHHRKVAVKVLRPELAAALGPERFLREIETTANLRHPHILPLYESGILPDDRTGVPDDRTGRTGDPAGRPYYIMPYVEGESLRDRLTRENQLPIDEALQIAREVADALGYAHERGVIHRDIKPENILLERGHAVVADFGIARAVTTAGGDKLTQTGMAVGTPMYMSPEQSVGEGGLDARSDLYALGCVLYEMLAGEPPYSGPTAQAIIAKRFREPVPRISTLRETVPPALEAALNRVLAKSPADRFVTAEEFVRALPSRRDQLSPPVSRSRRIRLAMAAVALVAAIAAVWTAARHSRSGATRASAPRSLAVLPFETVGNDTANAYFAEGIAEEVSNALTQVPGLRIAGRRSAMRFSGKGATAEEVGAALDVDAVLEGTVRRARDRIRVSAELTSASDGLVLWSQSYDRELKDVFAVQEEIARAIAGALQVTFASGNGAGRAARGTTDLEAYDLYLKGLYFYRRRTSTALTQSLASFEQAVARDSTFAAAHAALAMTLLNMPYNSLTPMGEVLPRARAAAQGAARLDPTLAEAHTALGLAHEEAFEWAEAETEYRRAIALDLNGAEAPYRLGRMFLSQRRVPEAIVELRLAKAKDPLYFVTAGFLGWALSLAGEYDAGLAEARRGLELEPNALQPLNILASSYYLANRPDSAAVFARRVAAAGSSIPARLGASAFVLARTGHRDEAEALVQKLEALPAGTWTRSSGLAFGYLGFGDTTRALLAMERAAATDGDLLVAFIRIMPNLLPSNPRFTAVMRHFNLDPAQMAEPAAPPVGRRTGIP